MSDDLVKRLRQSWDADRSIMSQTGQWMTERKDAADRIEQLEARLKKAIEIADDLAFAHAKWIADIDYEEFYSWREELEE